MLNPDLVWAVIFRTFFPVVAGYTSTAICTCKSLVAQDCHLQVWICGEVSAGCVAVFGPLARFPCFLDLDHLRAS